MWASLAALAVVLTIPPKRWERFLGLGGLTAILVAQGSWPLGVAVGAVVALEVWPERREPPWNLRWRCCAFWQSVALLTTAGLPVLTAVEDALPPGPWGQDVKRLAFGLANSQKDAMQSFLSTYTMPEAREIAYALEAAWHHGLDSVQAHRQALAMQERLSQERRMQQAHQPLWAAGLPALLLLNLLLVFLVPVIHTLVQGWAGL